jgi:hypothetical protein
VPNPYLLVAAALVAALSAWTGYEFGIDVQQGRYAVAMQIAIANTAEATRRDAETESTRRTEQAIRDAGRAAAARAARLKGQADAVKNARPGCDMPDGRVRLLNDAIAVANGADTEAGRVPDAVPVASDARQ